MTYFIGDKYKEFESATIEEAVDWCLTQTILVVDTETGRDCPKNKFDESIYKPGLNPHLSKLMLFQIGNSERKYIVDARINNIIEFKEVLESDKILKILHNAKFDAKMLLNLGIILRKVWDTMQCERLLFNGLPYSYSMEAIGKRYGFIKGKVEVDLFDQTQEDEEDEENENIFDLMDGKDEAVFVDKSIRTQFVEWGNKPFTVKQIEYAASDLDIPLKIYQKQLQGRLINGEIWIPMTAFRIENAVTIALAQMEYWGMELDKEGWLELYGRNLKTYKDKLEELDDYVITNYPKFSSKLDLFSGKNTCNIQWTSSAQVIKFFRSLGICPKERSKQTKKMEWTVGSKALFKLLTNENKDKFYTNQTIPFEKKDDFQALMLNYLLFKKFQMFTTTFGKDFLKYIHPTTGLIHCSFRQYMNTGRMSCTAPNLQNQPNGKEWRRLYTAPKNTKFIAIDFKSQELRYLCVLANIQNMKDFFINEHPIFKEDFHSFSATNMFRIVRNDPNLIVKKETHNKERTISKSLTFGINYGKGAFSVAQELGITEEEANIFIDGFLDGFPGLRENFDMRKKLAVKNGWIQISPYSDKRYFFPEFDKMKKLLDEGNSFYPEDFKTWSRENKEIWKTAERDRNSRYSEVWKEYMTLKGKLERRALNYPIQGGCSELSKIALLFMIQRGLKVVNCIHDEYCIYDDKGTETQTAEVANECMVKAGKYYSTEVEFGGDAAIGDYWIH